MLFLFAPCPVSTSPQSSRFKGRTGLSFAAGNWCQTELLILPGEEWAILSLYLLLSLDGEAPQEATPQAWTGDRSGAFLRVTGKKL